jgi:TPR repeat protein
MEAAYSWRQAALLQHGPSHAFMSNLLFDGKREVKDDVQQAFEFASYGAALGCADSKGALARCLVCRNSVAKDLRVGLSLSRESAGTGSCFGQFVFGVCYSAGYGVPKDQTEAERLWRLAAVQGHEIAQFHLHILGVPFQ